MHPSALTCQSDTCIAFLTRTREDEEEEDEEEEEEDAVAVLIAWSAKSEDGPFWGNDCCGTDDDDIDEDGNADAVEDGTPSATEAKGASEASAEVDVLVEGDDITSSSSDGADG
jgi:hypothetical protein